MSLSRVGSDFFVVDCCFCIIIYIYLQKYILLNGRCGEMNSFFNLAIR